MASGNLTFPPHPGHTDTMTFISDHATTVSGDIGQDFRSACNAYAGSSHADMTAAFKAAIIQGGHTWIGPSTAAYADFELGAGVDVTFTSGNVNTDWTDRDTANYEWQWDATNEGIRPIAKEGTSGDTFDHVHDSDIALASATSFDINVEWESITANASDIYGISFNSRPGSVTPWQHSEGLIAITDNFNRIEPDYGLFDQAGRTTNFTNQGNVVALTITTGVDYFIRMSRSGSTIIFEFGATADGVADSSTTFELDAGEQAELIGTGWGIHSRRNATRTPTFVVKKAEMGAYQSIFNIP